MKEREDRYFGKDVPGTEKCTQHMKCEGTGGMVHEEQGPTIATQREENT